MLTRFIQKYQGITLFQDNFPNTHSNNFDGKLLYHKGNIYLYDVLSEYKCGYVISQRIPIHLLIRENNISKKIIIYYENIISDNKKGALIILDNPSLFNLIYNMRYLPQTCANKIDNISNNFIMDYQTYKCL